MLELRHRRGKDGTFFFVAAQLVFVCACFESDESASVRLRAQCGGSRGVRGLLGLRDARIIASCAVGLLITCHRGPVGRQ